MTDWNCLSLEETSSMGNFESAKRILQSSLLDLLCDDEGNAYEENRYIIDGYVDSYGMSGLCMADTASSAE